VKRPKRKHAACANPRGCAYASSLLLGYLLFPWLAVRNACGDGDGLPQLQLVPVRFAESNPAVICLHASLAAPAHAMGVEL